jgi:hypothetical protein
MYIEEIQLDELNKDTLHSYVNKSEKDQDKQYDKIGRGIRDNNPKSANKAGHKFSMRSIGQNRAEKRLAKEASSPAQQAAIAIAMKKAGKKPKDMEESDAYDKDVKASPKPHDKEAAAARAKLAALAARKAMMTNKMSEAESHQSKTTMKHIDNPNAAELAAAKRIKPGIKGVRDRFAMLQAAKNRGALKNEDVDLLSNLYDQLDESNQEIFLNQLEEDAEVLLAFAKTIAEE